MTFDLNKLNLHGEISYLGLELLQYDLILTEVSLSTLQTTQIIPSSNKTTTKGV